MTRREGDLGILLAVCLGLALALATGSAALPTIQDPESSDEQTEADEAPEGGDTGGAAEGKRDRGKVGWKPVRVGRARGGQTVAWTCQERWERCNEQVESNLASAWQVHQARRLACDSARARFESACDYAERPKRCERRARADRRRCESIANRDQARQLKQIQRQRKACAQVYRVCAGI